MINTTKLMNQVTLFSNIDQEDYVNGQLNIIGDSVRAGNVLKATVTVTILHEDGEVTHQEINVDNESDLYCSHGFIAEGGLGDAADIYRNITEATKTTLVNDPMLKPEVAEVLIGGKLIQTLTDDADAN